MTDQSINFATGATTLGHLGDFVANAGIWPSPTGRQVMKRPRKPPCKWPRIWDSVTKTHPVKLKSVGLSAWLLNASPSTQWIRAVTGAAARMNRTKPDFMDCGNGDRE